MNKTRVSIQFTSLTSLWDFRLAIDANVFEMNMRELTITCPCTKEHMHLAVQKYNGKIIEIKQEAGSC